MTDMHEETRAERLTHEMGALDIAAVLGAVGDRGPAEVRESAEFSIDPVDIHRYGNVDDLVRITRVKVVVTRYAAGDPEDDGTGYIRVEGYGRPLTQSGKPNQRKDPQWYWLPNELAAPLLLQAHTHTR